MRIVILAVSVLLFSAPALAQSSSRSITTVLHGKDKKTVYLAQPSVTGYAGPAYATLRVCFAERLESTDGLADSVYVSMGAAVQGGDGIWHELLEGECTFVSGQAVAVAIGSGEGSARVTTDLIQ